MARFVLRRIVALVVVLLLTSLLIFFMMRVAGGDIVSVTLGANATPERVDAFRERFGLNAPLVTQYADWMLGLLHGDLGQTFVSHTSIGQAILERLPVTASLIVGALLIEAIIALPLGTLAALHARNAFGSALTLIGQIGIAIPTFWAGVLIASFVGVTLGWFPTSGWVSWSDNPLGTVQHLVLPCVSLAVVEAAGASRYVRTSMLGVLNEDYMRMSRATGMSRRATLVKVGWRNAALPIVTVFGLQAASLIGGAVVIEKVFALPGLSSLILEAVGRREVVEVQSSVMVLVFFVALINFLVDILYGVLDPRVRAWR